MIKNSNLWLDHNEKWFELFNEHLKRWQLWIDSYCKEYPLSIKLSSESTVIAETNFDQSENPIITLNPLLISEKYWFTFDEFLFVLLHEITHWIEWNELTLDEKEYINSVNENRELDDDTNIWSIHALENTFRDIFCNERIVHPTNLPGLFSARKDLYVNLFESNDLRIEKIIDQEWNLRWYKPIPKHVQLLVWLLLGEQDPTRNVIVDPIVKRYIDVITGYKKIRNASIHWNLVNRLDTIRKNIEPLYLKLLEKDKEEQNDGLKKSSPEEISDLLDEREPENWEPESWEPENWEPESW